MARNFPYPSHPTGWFQVAWADELVAGDVVPLSYFGGEQVLYRDDDGAFHAFDAFCPHLGAHLGYGGKVDGSCIVCPFHGWKFEEAGRNVEIPYADRVNRAKGLRPWPVREVNGWVLVWHDAAGGEPTWEPDELPEWSSGDYWAGTEARALHTRIRVHPQMIIENLVDAAHQQFVHKGSAPTDIFDYGPEGAIFRVKNRMALGVGKDKTWLTPDGVYDAELHTEAWGLGIAVARFVGQDDAVHIQTVTPIDDEWADLRATVLIKTSDLVDGRPSEEAATRFKFEIRQLERDIVIWEHMRYEPRAPFAGFEVKPFNAFRRWADQFYAEAKTSR